MTSILKAVEQDYKRAGGFAREIVAKRLAVTNTVGGGVSALLLTHVISVGQSDRITAAIAGGFALLANLVGVLWARDGVTPADPALDPTSNAGEALIPLPGSSTRASRPTPPAAVIAAQAAAALTGASIAAPATGPQSGTLAGGTGGTS